jgi:hypothetical protein
MLRKEEWPGLQNENTMIMKEIVVQEVLSRSAAK